MDTMIKLDTVLDLVRAHQVMLEKLIHQELYRSREVLTAEAQAISKLYDDIRRAAK